MPKTEHLIVGVDTGGTFTDFVYITPDGSVGTYKTLSTPKNPAEAVLKGLDEIGRERISHVVHGSTVATNAVLERKGVKTALITNAGFEDIIEIGRQCRERLYDLKYVKPSPLVPESLRFGLRGRIAYTGDVLEQLDPEEVEQVVEKIRRLGAESVAVCFLFSFVNPEHERVVEEICEKKGLAVSVSHRILPEFREFERTSTTVLNAYVSPIMKRYLSYLVSHLGDENRLRIMQSNGGSISSGTAMVESIRTILSGPAGGVVGASEIGRIAGFDKLITFDMGGTSTDVSLVDGKVSLTMESKISGWPIKVPMIDIHTVGAGGGSIARIDPGGSLKVGPESAGADPGPICYGKGEEVTVTDANLFLGRLLPDRFLGGKMKLDLDRVIPRMEELARRAGLDPVELAEGILDVANATMEKAIRVISVERGYDPQEFTLVSFGGAGGMHAAFLAELLSIPRVLVPENPGLLSAYGMLLADVVKDYSLTVMLGERDASYEVLNGHLASLLRKGREDLMEEGISEEDIFLEKYLDMRYEGQSHEILVPFDENFVENFHVEHERLFGYKNPHKRVEVVNVRVRARGVPEKPVLSPKPVVEGPVPEEAVLGDREVVFYGKRLKTKVIERSRLSPGNRLDGPAIVVEYSSTTVIPPGWTVLVDGFSNMILSRV